MIGAAIYFPPRKGLLFTRPSPASSAATISKMPLKPPHSPPRVFEDRFQDHSTSHTHIRNLQFAPCRGYHIRDFSISIKSLAWLWGSSGGLGHMYYGLQFDNLGCITVRSKQMARRVARCTLPHGLPVMS